MVSTPRKVVHLPGDLAKRVQFLREKMDWTQNRLSVESNLPLQFIQDIESGLETFMAPAIRLRLARALRVKSGVLQEVEQRPTTGSEGSVLTNDEALDLLQAMVDRPTRTYFCPKCGAKLEVRIFQRRDLYDNLLTAVKAHCTQCLFRIQND